MSEQIDKFNKRYSNKKDLAKTQDVTTKIDSNKKPQKINLEEIDRLAELKNTMEKQEIKNKKHSAKKPKTPKIFEPEKLKPLVLDEKTEAEGNEPNFYDNVLSDNEKFKNKVDAVSKDPTGIEAKASTAYNAVSDVVKDNIEDYKEAGADVKNLASKTKDVVKNLGKLEGTDEEKENFGRNTDEIIKQQVEEQKKLEQAKIDALKENSKKESWFKNKFEILKTKLNIRSESLTASKKALFEKLSKAGTFVGTNWDKIKDTQGFQNTAKAAAWYTNLMNNGPKIFEIKIGKNPDGTDKYYKYTWAKLAQHGLLTGAAIAFAPVSATAAAGMFGTKIARGVIGGVFGGATMADINHKGHKIIERINLEKEKIDPSDTEKIKSLERKMRNIKLATNGAAIIVGLGVGMGASMLAGDIANHEWGTNKHIIHENKSGGNALDKQKITEQPKLKTKRPADSAKTVSPEKNQIETGPDKEAPVSKNEVIPEEAKIKSGLGITHAFKSQLEANETLAKDLGYDKNWAPEDKANFLKELGEKTGYISQDGQVLVKEGVGAAYELKYEGEKVLVNEYQNGKLIETHTEGAAFENEKELDTYEYNDKPKISHGENNVDYTTGSVVENHTGNNTAPEQVAPTEEQLKINKNEAPVQTDPTPEQLNSNLADKQVNAIEQPKIINLENTIWAKPENLNVDYYFNGEKYLNSLDKNTLNSLISNGKVIDRTEINPFTGETIHHYEMTGTSAVKEIKDAAEKTNQMLGRSAINTNPYPNESMQHYMERMKSNMEQAIRSEERIREMNGGYSNREIQDMKNESDMRHEYLQERKLDIHPKWSDIVRNFFNRH